jgi:O-antigen ligase
VQSTDRESHSLYAGILAENGFLGFIAFFGAVGVLLRRLNRSRRRWLSERPDLADLSAGFFLALVAYLASGIFLHMAFQRYYWLLFALAAACVHATEEIGRPATVRERALPAARQARQPAHAG